MRKSVYIFLILLYSLQISAQKMHNICGEYTYYPPLNVSLDEAKKVAVERAKLKALADEFGTVINQNNTTVVKNENGRSTTDFKSLSESEVKGEWIENSKDPEINISYNQGMLVVTAKVCGKAREIVRAGITFSAKLLRNGTEDKFENTDFKNNDDLFLSFQSPANGYLSVYLVDEDQNAFCLLPYLKDSDGQVKIEHGQHYLFFNTEAAPESEKAIVDELVITCSKSIEHNQVYVIFSPNFFIKANDQLKSENLPRELSYADFLKWLTKNRNIDKDMQVEIKNIQITK